MTSDQIQAWWNMWQPGLAGWPMMGGNFEQAWSKALEQMQSALPTGQNGSNEMPALKFDTDKLRQLQLEYVQDAAQLWNQALQSNLTLDDRRFRGDDWKSNPLASFTAAVYLLNSRTMMSLVDTVDCDEKTRARLGFAVQQWIAASAPSNFLAFNAEAQKKAIETKGESLAKGVQNMLADMQRGRVSMTDESVFEVGRNVATTEGAVVFENEFFQLLEYKPLTDKVYERPLLFVPPCINKYYILDLQPDNSLIRYAVSQGHRTFVISWRNPVDALEQATWEDYVEQAVIKAIQVAGEIGGGKPINALGFCVGGTLLVTALATLAARDEHPVASTTLLTTLVDFTDTGILDVFIDEAMVHYREMQIGQGGLLDGQELASTFNFLRPNDLVWNYVVDNYLKGETPPAFDLLYWNSDSTNLPGPFYSWYLRHTYLQNDLVKPGAVSIGGEPLDLSKIDTPFYLYGSQRDHIVPIGGAYASTQVLPGKKRFVMGASGHIAGVINPPLENKRCHWIRSGGRYPTDFEKWEAAAEKVDGSWWPDWADWIKGYGGKEISAPKRYGRGQKYKELEPAPGSYVKARI